MDFLVRECQSLQWRIISCYIRYYCQHTACHVK